MFSFPAADFDVDYRDVEAQKRLLRERTAGLGWLTARSRDVPMPDAEPSLAPEEWQGYRIPAPRPDGG